MTNDQDPLLVMVYQTNPFTEGQGGGVRYVHELISAIEKEGHELIFFGAGGKSETRGNIRYISVMQRADRTILFMLNCLWARWRYLGTRKAVVHVHRLYFSIPFLGASKRCVATLHGRTFTVFPERFGVKLSRVVFPIFKALEGWLLKRVERVVVVSRDVSEQFQIRHGDRWSARSSELVPTMVNLSTFEPNESDFFKETIGDHNICLFIGRLAAVKNLPLLLSAWEIVAEKDKDARLVIAGDGELRGELEKSVAYLSCNARTILLGEVSPTCIAEVISGSNVLIITSHHESGPMVAKEALACGVPVVSTPVGDIADVIDDGQTGRIVEPDASKLANAILEVLRWNKKKSEIANAARPNLEKYTPKRVAEMYLSIYRELGYPTR